eukprot:TRINITY_DN54652_c0_g1_i2.p1 TRINITY_DN54652_c0_g1~~TRINITY_DN54652_c0_g1_i2.p1  ORF type:complete len:250 (-),score=29.89 TRINITY_DN54652_c0_g1_i2:22-702(-)
MNQARSMNFFTAKGMYSQHFHSLRLRSSRQDVMFKDITAYLRSAQAYDEHDVKEFEKLCEKTVDKNTMETGTTIDGAWSCFKQFVGHQYIIQADAFKTVREETAKPMYNVTQAAEHQLKILFQEAKILELKAAQGKAIVETAKSRRNIMMRKYQHVKKNLKKDVLSQSDIAKVVAARSDAEDATLVQDEAETSFQTIISEYEERMPEIGRAVQQECRDRSRMPSSA